MGRYGFDRDDVKSVDVGMRLYMINDVSKLLTKAKDYLAGSNMFRKQTDVIRADLNRIETSELDIIHKRFKEIYGSIDTFKTVYKEYIEKDPHNWDLEYDTAKKELNVVFQMISVIKKSRNKPESQTYTSLKDLSIGIKNFVSMKTYNHCLIDTVSYAAPFIGINNK